MDGWREEEKEDRWKRKEEKEIHFVLIHGFCGGAWCWYKLKCLMESSGHRATCVDLRASGTDSSTVSSVVSFADYNLPLDLFFTSLPEDHKVVLVGHSAGGLSVSAALRKFPHKIQVAVYVAATMLPSGFHSPHDVTIGIPDMSEYGDVFEYPDPRSAIFKKEYLRKLVYPMSSMEDFTLAAILSRPGPMEALSCMSLPENMEDDDDDDDAWSSVRRVYIKTLQDKLLKPEQQEAMIQKWAPHQVYHIHTDHSPFFSDPFILFRLLLTAASPPLPN